MENNQGETLSIGNFKEFTSDEEEYISPEDLISKLEDIIIRIKEGSYNHVKRQDIADAIDEYLPGGKENPLSPEVISYIFTGWWVNYLSKISQENDTDPQSLFKIEKCPFCFREFDEGNVHKDENDNK